MCREYCVNLFLFSPQSDLPGFIDPAIGDKKSLLIYYLYAGEKCYSLTDDQSFVHLPNMLGLG